MLRLGGLCSDALIQTSSLSFLTLTYTPASNTLSAGTGRREPSPSGTTDAPLTDYSLAPGARVRCALEAFTLVKNVRHPSLNEKSANMIIAYFDSASEGREEHEERLAQEAREKEELRLTKARFNSTPLRRILLRQVFGEQHNGDQVMEGTGRQVVTESDDTLRADSVVSEDGANLKTSVVIESREERTERWTLEVRAEVRHRKPASARKSNTPLRRIIERQAVLSLEGKLECH